MLGVRISYEVWMQWRFGFLVQTRLNWIQQEFSAQKRLDSIKVLGILPPFINKN